MFPLLKVAKSYIRLRGLLNYCSGVSCIRRRVPSTRACIVGCDVRFHSCLLQIQFRAHTVFYRAKLQLVFFQDCLSYLVNKIACLPFASFSCFCSSNCSFSSRIFWLWEMCRLSSSTLAKNYITTLRKHQPLQSLPIDPFLSNITISLHVSLWVQKDVYAAILVRFGFSYL